MPPLRETEEGRSTRRDVVAKVWPHVRAVEDHPLILHVEALAHDVATFAFQWGSGSRRRCMASIGELPSSMVWHPAQRENMSRRNRRDERL